MLSIARNLSRFYTLYIDFSRFQLTVSIEDILRMNEDFQEELAMEERQRSRLERQKKEEQATQGKYLDYYNDRMAYLKEHKLLPYDDNFNFPKQEPIYEEVEF